MEHTQTADMQRLQPLWKHVGATGRGEEAAERSVIKARLSGGVGEAPAVHCTIKAQDTRADRENLEAPSRLRERCRCATELTEEAVLGPEIELATDDELEMIVDRVAQLGSERAA